MKKLKNFYTVLLILSIFFITSNVFAATNKSSSSHLHKEAEYQHAWCCAHRGIEEYKNPDFTRVDCLTDTHAVEFDFAKKWAESVGQALYYQLMTGKRAKVVLILEEPQSQMVYYNRVKRLSCVYNFDVEYITPSYLYQRQ